MKIHWARIALVAVALLGVRAAAAQESIAVKSMPQYAISRGGWLPPVDESLVGLGAGQALIAPPERPVPLPVVMYGGMGGSIAEHVMRFTGIGRSGASVEMRGGCWSACTLLTSYVSKERLCFAPGSFLAFHAAVANLNIPLRSESATRAMFDSYPPEIKYWINVHGGVANLEVGSYWTMYDRELWAIGYPRCK